MLNTQRVSRVEFQRIMKRRRIRTYWMLGIIFIFLMYVVGVISYEYGMKKEYCEFLINMDAGNFNIKELKRNLEKYESRISIEDVDYEMSDEVKSNNSPKSIIIHHTAVDNLTPENINLDHKKRGYGGIGYHFYIRKDGTVYRGREEELEGAHTIGRNHDSIGICIEGNFENEELNEIQENSLVMLITEMIIKYNIKDIIGHRDEYQTLCPGKNLSIESIREKVKDKLISMAK